MKNKNQKPQKSVPTSVAKPPFDLSQKVEDTAQAFVRSIEALVKQALQEHIRAATADLMGVPSDIVSVRPNPNAPWRTGAMPIATGGAPLAGPSKDAKKPKKAKKAKKNKAEKASKSAKAPKESKPVVLSPADEELQEKLLIFLEATPGSRVEAMTEALKARPEAVRRVVARLYEQKKLVRRGKTRGTKYSLAPKE